MTLKAAFTSHNETLTGTLSLTILNPGVAWQLTTTDGGIYLIRKDGTALTVTAPTAIQAIAAAASLAVGVGVLGGAVGISGAGAVATNVILTKTNAYIADSTVTSQTDVDLDAVNTAIIRAKIISVSLAVAGGFVGAAASIGVSVARNFIGYTVDGTKSAAEVHALIERSSVTAGGSVTLDALSSQTIEALVVAASVAVAGGLFGLSASGAGATTENRVGADVKASIDGDGADGIQAASIALSARDTSRIKADTASVAVAATIALGGAAAIAVASASNTIDNAVEASIKNANTATKKVKATTGGITLDAHETATITALTVAAAFAVAIAGFSGGGAQATNTTTTRTKAFIANSTLVESNLAVKLTADDRSTISATLPVISATLGLVGGAGAVSLTTNTIGAEVDAYIDGSKVTVTAGNVEITATSHATVTADTLTIAVAIAIGIAGGVSDAKVFVNGHTQAYLGRLAEVVADAGLVKIIATSSSTATATVDGGGGTIGVTVQSFRGEAQTNTTTRASVGDGSIIHALDADLTATATNTPSATVTTTAVGLVSSGGVIVIAKDTSTVEAYIGAATGTTSTAGRTAAVTATGSGSTIDVKASLIAPITATGSVLSISLGAGSKTESEATATQTVRAYVGDGGAPNASGGGNVNLAANANTQVAAKGTGVAVGLGVGYGGATVTATLNPIVKTFTEGTSSIGGDDVTLTSTLNQTDVGAPIKQTVDGDEVGPSYAKVTLGAGGLGAGIAGGTVNSYNSPTVVTGVGSSTTVTATGDVVIQSKVFQLAETNGLSIAVAVGVGVGTVVAIATASGSTTTHFDGTLNGGADSLTVQGTVKATSNSSGRAVGGAILGAFTGPTIKAETKPNVTTRLGGTITASGDIVAKSDVTTAAIAVGSAFTVSLLVAIAKVNVDAIDSPTVGTSVSAGSVITSTGGDVTISALHNFPYPTTPTDLTKGAHASADIKGGGTISVGDTDVDATAGANVDTTVAATATLRALATDGLHGVIEVIARSSNIADARVKSATGGVIDISIANPTATASGPDPTDATKTCATEGGCTTANMLGNVLASGGGAGARRLSVLAEGSAVTSSNLDTRGGGLIKITTGSTALAESKPTVTTTVGGSNSTIVTSGNIDVQATGITDADASATTVSGGFVNVALFSSTAKTQPNVNVVVAASSTLGSGGTITIGASHNPVTQALSDGSFTAPGAVDTAERPNGQHDQLHAAARSPERRRRHLQRADRQPADGLRDQRAGRRPPVRRHRRGQRHAPARRRLLGRTGRHCARRDQVRQPRPRSPGV